MNPWSGIWHSSGAWLSESGKVMRWKPHEIEEIVETEFTIPEQEDTFCYHEVFSWDRIRTGSGDYNSGAIFFEFSNESEEVNPSHLRLVMDRLPSGKLYTWPVVGTPDKPSIDDVAKG